MHKIALGLLLTSMTISNCFSDVLTRAEMTLLEPTLLGLTQDKIKSLSQDDRKDLFKIIDAVVKSKTEVEISSTFAHIQNIITSPLVGAVVHHSADLAKGCKNLIGHRVSSKSIMEKIAAIPTGYLRYFALPLGKEVAAQLKRLNLEDGHLEANLAILREAEAYFQAKLVDAADFGKSETDLIEKAIKQFSGLIKLMATPESTPERIEREVVTAIRVWGQAAKKI